ncbi:MAG TPA: class I SAM-dependent methyltransferase [Candidatus Limnocylindrales bacterium]|nr:class I SAM-dependent methyltransferase [Candidatus Limnocylindrales bacterium]
MMSNFSCNQGMKNQNIKGGEKVMKCPLYTKSIEENILKEIDNSGGQFTAEEHAYIFEKEYGKFFETKDSLLGWVIPQSTYSLLALNWLIQYIKKNRFSRVLSMGAGNCVLEYLLKCAIPECEVTAADFDSYFIDKANVFFPSIKSVIFDFFKDNITKLNSEFDLVVFFGSAYVMDDKQFVDLFRQIKENNVKQIIDFHGGCIPYSEMLRYFIGDILRRFGIIRSYRGKFTGYVRTKNELRGLYKKAGMKSIIEMHIASHRYVAIISF